MTTLKTLIISPPRRFKVYLLPPLLAIILLFVVGSARAQEVAGVRLQPAIIEQRIDAGQVFDSKIQVTNIGSEEKTFYIIKRDIRTLSPDGFPVFFMDGEATEYEISSWIKVSEQPITLGSGKTREVPFSVVVPAHATPGGHFGGLFVTLTPARSQQNAISVGYQVGTLISFRVSGEIIEDAQLRGFSPDALVYAQPKVNFLAKIENLGNVLIRPHGILEVVDPFGRQEVVLNINEEAAAIFPKTTRDFRVSWDSDRLLLGPYQATLSLTYGEEGRKSLTDVITFWIIPLKTILLILGGIVIVVLGIFALIRFQVRKRVRQIIKHSSEMPRLVHRKSSLPLLAIAGLMILVATLMLLVLAFLFFA